MALMAALEQAWKGVEHAAKGGYLKNRSMLAFAWWKEIHELRPDLHITYEAGADCPTLDQTDLIIWQDAGTPSVLFAGELRFPADGLLVSESIIAKLLHLEQSQTLMVPKRDAKSGEISTHWMLKSDDFIFGLFIEANRDTVATMWAEVTRLLREPGRTGFHFAFGSISNGPIVESVFRTLSPGQKHD